MKKGGRAWRAGGRGFMVAQTVKCPPAVGDSGDRLPPSTCILEKIMAKHSSILARESRNRGASEATVHESAQWTRHRRLSIYTHTESLGGSGSSRKARAKDLRLAAWGPSYSLVKEARKGL